MYGCMMECDILGTSSCDLLNQSSNCSFQSARNSSANILGTSFDVFESDVQSVQEKNHSATHTLSSLSYINDSSSSEGVLGTSSCDLPQSSDVLGTSFSLLDENAQFSHDETQKVPIATSTPMKFGEFDKVCAKDKRQKDVCEYLISEVGTSSGQLAKKALMRASIYAALKKNCECPQKCIGKMDFDVIRDLRVAYWNRTTKPVRKELLRRYVENSFHIGQHRMFTFSNETIVCSKTFLNVLQVNKNTLSSALKYQKESLRQRQKSDRTLLAMNWLEEFASFMGDRMPHSPDILLPVKMVKEYIYNKYKTDSATHPISRSQFFKLWRVYFPHLKIKQTNSFSKCSTCSTLEKKWENSENLHEKAKFRKLKEEHYERQQMERRYYYGKRESSRQQPDKFMSVIIDGMDQSKTNLPHFAGRRSKNINPCDLLKTHVTGVINHGHGGLQTYVDVNEYPHDPNLTINVLLKTLEKTAISMGNKLPPCLYLQADNCYRENKNKSVLGFLEYLVAANIFKEVHISFLIVGHTHEDVDAAFSRVSMALAKTDAETIDNLLSVLPNSEQLNKMYDIKTWLEPFIVNVRQHTQPLHFKFESSSESVNVMYKGRYDDAWINMNGHFLRELPIDEPSILKPDYAKIDITRIIKQVESIKHFFKYESTLRKWRELQYCMESEINTSTEESPLGHLPRQVDMIPEFENFEVPVVLQSLIDKETRIPEVIVPKRQRKQ